MTNSLYTVGHSTHSQDKLLSLLGCHSITAVADVRSHPYSRMNPQFNRETLNVALKGIGASYVFLGHELGARPKDRRCYDRNGYVLYDRLAKTDLFRKGLARAAQGTKNYRVALLCAEKDPLTCHRAILVCRYLVKDYDATVQHILEDGTLENHDDALDRLFNELKIYPKQELFLDYDELVEEAYRRRGEEIAYKEENVARLQLACEVES